MRNFSFSSSGSSDEDERIARRFELHSARMQLNVCPNGCAEMIWDDPHNRHCPKCNFSGFSTKPYDIKTTEA
jgi:hypothetical protein